MSKATKRHCAGTVQSQGGRVRNVKQVSFEPGPEDSYGRCGSDKIGYVGCNSIIISMQDIFRYISSKTGWTWTKLGRGVRNGEILGATAADLIRHT